jgi:hypothetical protein
MKTPSHPRRWDVGAALVAALALMAPLPSAAQSAGPPSAEELSKQLANPVASLVSVPFQSNWEFGVGPEEKTRYLMNFQPVMPFSLNDDWNLIGRVIVPIVSQPPLVRGAETTFGFGDLVTSFFLSPTEGSIVWGVGPVLLVPAGADPFLGTEKWGAGPTAVALKQMGPWTVGGLVNHIWSYGGNDDRDPVNQTFLQPFLTYATKTGYSFTLQTETTANWEAASGQKWTVPVNVLVGKVTTLGKRPISFQLGAGYFVEKPTGGPDWKLRAAVTLLFPK